jgi:hypothetical protein
MQVIVARYVFHKDYGESVPEQLQKIVERLNQQKWRVLSIIPPPASLSDSRGNDYSFLCEPDEKTATTDV